MAIRIVGVDLPQNKRGEIALTYVYGIGRSSSAKILDKAGVDKDLKVKDWTDDQAAKIREIIGAEYKVEGDLRSEIQLNIKRLMDIGCYRGVRHRIGLPVRGQSTKNNARTVVPIYFCLTSCLLVLKPSLVNPACTSGWLMKRFHNNPVR